MNCRAINYINALIPNHQEFKSTKYALEQHTKVVKKTLSCGTTTACYFATIHKDSSVILAEVCKKLGQRAFVGKVNMDRNSPEGYIEASAEESLKDTEG